VVSVVPRIARMREGGEIQVYQIAVKPKTAYADVYPEVK
jgi:hypothetical protein